MATGYEVEMYQNIGIIARNTNRIANCMEADEKRKREDEDLQSLIIEAIDLSDEREWGASDLAFWRGADQLARKIRAILDAR